MASAFALGPFVVPLQSLMLAFAGTVALLAGWLAGRRDGVGIARVLLDMFVAGMAAARLAFVAEWFELYRAAPWTMLDIRDGGFTAWAGVAAALATAAWLAWRKAPLRKPLAVGIACGAVTWTLLALLPSPPDSRALPTVPLVTLEGAQGSVAALAAGAPTVVNLWATWCPPCLREMPVLAEAQRREAGVRFLFVNQGEDRVVVDRFVATRFPELRGVLLDPDSALGREVGAPGLPTTLFYDASGRLAEAHVGPLSRASLAARLNAVRGRRGAVN